MREFNRTIIFYSFKTDIQERRFPSVDMKLGYYSSSLSSQVSFEIITIAIITIAASAWWEILRCKLLEGV